MLTMTTMEHKLQRAGRKHAALYLFCNFISLMLISAYAALMFSPTVLNILPDGGDSRKQVYAIFVLALFGCVVFTIYAASLFFRKKSKQLGVLMALGASRKRLIPGVFREVLTLSASSSFLGIAAGFPFTWLLWNAFRFFFANTEEMTFHFDFRCLIIPVLFLIIVTAFSCLTAYRYLRKTNIIDVVQEEHKNEPVREPGKWCGPVGFLLLFAGAVAGYAAPSVYISVFSAYPTPLINLFYLPVFIGLYMVMLHTVVHGWNRRKKHPYKNIISRSMMKFQGKQTVNNLLVSTVLIAGGCFGLFYAPVLFTSSVLETNSRAYDYSFHYRADQNVPGRNAVENIASGYNLTLKDWQDHEYISLALDGEAQVENGRNFHYEYFPLLQEGNFITENTFNKISGQNIRVAPGSYYAVTAEDTETNFYLSTDSTMLTNMCTMKQLPVSFKGYVRYGQLSSQSRQFYVLNNEDYITLSQGLTKDWMGNLFFFNIDGEDNYNFARDLYLVFVHSFDKECEKIYAYDRVAKYNAEQEGTTYWGDTSEMTAISYDKPDSSDFRMYWAYMPQIRILDQNNFMQVYAVFIMAFIFIAIICLTAALIICYTRCQTIAINNGYIFDDLKKLGAPPQFLVREVKNQCGKVFSVPAIIGMSVMYFFYVMIMYANDGVLSSPEIAGLGVCFCLLLLIGILIYGIYFKTIQKICRQLHIAGGAQSEYKKINL